MAQVSDHIALANKNQKVLDYLLEQQGRFPEWIATVSFYKAVQLAEALFVDQDGRNCHDHGRRLEKIKSTTKYQPLYRHFRVLWTASTIARYLYDNDSNTPYSSFEDYINAGQVAEKIVRNRLRKFEQIVLQNLSEPVRITVTQVTF